MKQHQTPTNLEATPQLTVPEKTTSVPTASVSVTEPVTSSTQPAPHVQHHYWTPRRLKRAIQASSCLGAGVMYLVFLLHSHRNLWLAFLLAVALALIGHPFKHWLEAVCHSIVLKLTSLRHYPLVRMAISFTTSALVVLLAEVTGQLMGPAPASAVPPPSAVTAPQYDRG